MPEELDAAKERELIAQVQTGSDTERADAFEILARRNTPQLVRVLIHWRLAHDERWDVINETWKRVWLKIGPYEDRGYRFFAWVRRIADYVTRELPFVPATTAGAGSEVTGFPVLPAVVGRAGIQGRRGGALGVREAFR